MCEPWGYIARGINLIYDKNRRADTQLHEYPLLALYCWFNFPFLIIDHDV